MEQQKTDDVIRAIKILDVVTPFSIIDIKNAYKARAKALHPDLDPSEFKSEEQMKEVNWAYHLLLKHLELIKIPVELLLTASQTDEEWLKKRFYYDWMPPDKEVETV